MKRLLLCYAFSFCIISPLLSQNTIRIATWNIEHLGSGGRGLGGIGSGGLPRRTEQQIQSIANYIRDSLKVSIIAVQEVAVDRVAGNMKFSDALDVLIQTMGESWDYHIGSPGNGIIAFGSIHNMQNAFIWNRSSVRGISFFDHMFPNEYVGGKSLYDRLPLYGYFEVLKNGQGTNDFLLCNVHLTSGQNNDENHLTSMIIIEQNLKDLLKQQNIRESDRIILGDFNDNPFALKNNGAMKYSNWLYQYMEWKKYDDLVTENTGATRMDTNLRSAIDHILVNNSARRHMKTNSFKKHQVSNDPAILAEWRKTYSDHFPLSFGIKIANKDDDVD